MKASKIILYGFLLLSFSTVFAEEGFHDDFSSLPGPVQDWQNRLFMPYSEDGQQPRGTAFLLKNDGEIAVFITAAHVIQNPQAFLKTMTLRQGSEWTLLSDEPFQSPINLKPIEAGVLNAKDKAWKNAGNAGDLGYILTSSHPSLPKIANDSIVDITEDLFSKSSNRAGKHYVLGFPSLASRNPELSVKQIIKLRWSQGDLLRKVIKNTKFAIETDADSLKGNSGSPIVNQNGELLGIVTGGPTISEYKPYPFYYTYAAGLSSLKALMELIVQRDSKILSKSCLRVLQ